MGMEKKYGIRAVNLSYFPKEPIHFDYKGRSFELPLPAMLLHEVDQFITVPVPKVHMNTQMSVAIKNQWGCIPEPTVRLKLHPFFEKVIYEINKNIRANMAVVDGRYGLNHSGPMVGDVVELNWIMVADSILATDVAVCRLMQIDPSRVYYLHYIDSHRPYPALTLADLHAQADRIAADQRPVSDELHQELGQVIAIEETGLAGSLVERRIALVEMAYEKGIASFDSAFAVLQKGLEQIPAARDAAMIVTSDHGEALYEHGYGNHGVGLHDDELAIPLVARLPGVRASSNPISCQVGLIDVLPTLCDYLGLECPKVMSGWSWLRPSPERRWLAAEGLASKPRNRTVRNRDWKLLWEPDSDGPVENSYRLYHVAVDPGEREDLAGSSAPEARRALERLEPALHGAVAAFARPARSTAPIDPALEQRLRGLGYLEDKK